jgi:hypothetical protein
MNFDKLFNNKLFLISAQDGSDQHYAPASSPPGKSPPLPIGLVDWGAPESVWMLRTEEKLCLCRESNHVHPARRPSLYQLSYLNSPPIQLGIVNEETLLYISL